MYNAFFDDNNIIRELLDSFFNYILDHIYNLHILNNNLENNSNEDSLQLFNEYENHFNENYKNGNYNTWRNDYLAFIEKDLYKDIEKSHLPE